MLEFFDDKSERARPVAPRSRYGNAEWFVGRQDEPCLLTLREEDEDAKLSDLDDDGRGGSLFEEVDSIIGTL